MSSRRAAVNMGRMLPAIMKICDRTRRLSRAMGREAMGRTVARLSRPPTWCALMALVTASPLGSAAEPSLQDALERALVRFETETLPEAPQSIGWMAGPASLAVSHLESDQSLGTNETELSLTFPIKSPRQRDNDRVLVEGEPGLDEAREHYRRWYLSGTLRALFARHCLAEARLPALVRGSGILEESASKLQARVAAGSAERFELLAVRRSMLDSAEQLRRQREQSAGTTAEYRRLTGLGDFPSCKDAGTLTAVPAQLAVQDHPQLILMAEQYQRERASLLATAPRSAPWTLGVVGRELEIPSFTERQLGIALTVPLNFGQDATTGTRSDLRALHRDYWQQRDQLLQQLQLRWQETQAELAALLRRREEGSATLDEASLSALIEATRDSQELPIDLKLARLQSLLDASAEVPLTRARINAAAATLRQLAGESL